MSLVKKLGKQVSYGLLTALLGGHGIWALGYKEPFLEYGKNSIPEIIKPKAISPLPKT